MKLGLRYGAGLAACGRRRTTRGDSSESKADAAVGGVAESVVRVDAVFGEGRVRDGGAACIGAYGVRMISEIESTLSSKHPG